MGEWGLMSFPTKTDDDRIKMGETSWLHSQGAGEGWPLKPAPSPSPVSSLGARLVAFHRPSEGIDLRRLLAEWRPFHCHHSITRSLKTNSGPNTSYQNGLFFWLMGPSGLNIFIQLQSAARVAIDRRSGRSPGDPWINDAWTGSTVFAWPDQGKSEPFMEKAGHHRSPLCSPRRGLDISVPDSMPKSFCPAIITGTQGLKVNIVGLFDELRGRF